MPIRFWGLVCLLVACDPAAEDDPTTADPTTPTPAPASVDADGDGFDATEDCDDANAAVFPGATEVCNTIDDDCDDAVDEDVTTDFYVDADQDGYGDASAAAQAACSAPAGTVDNALDCDDTTDAVSPDATEICNGVDDDCANGADDGLIFTDWYPDADGDGYGDPAARPESSCAVVTDKVDNALDCDDTTKAVMPGAVEVCNGVDDDCANGIDDGLAQTAFYPDVDQDTYGDSSATAVMACVAPPDTVTNALDCDDATSAVSPDATETCNGIDDDCANGIDDGLVFADWYPDGDLDGYGDATATPVNDCEAPANHVLDHTDCDDALAAVNPLATETCNGVDDDCANGIDDGLVFQDWYPDGDLDGYGDATATPINDCQAPADYVVDNTDCDDTALAVNPAATETCNGIDDDCANGVDDGLGTPRVNLALGATATATNTYPGYSVARVVDGDPSTQLGENHGWTNANGGRGTAEIEIDFGTDVTFGRIDVYSVTGYETQGFEVETWDGAAWNALHTAASLTDARTVLTFEAVTTDRLRFSALEGSVAQTGYARINEIEVYANQAPDASLTATSTFSGYDVALTVDGLRDTAVGAGWANNGSGTLPATVTYDFGECRGFDVFVLTTSTGYEIADYDIEYYDGTAWQPLDSVVGNTDLVVESVATPVYGQSVRVVSQAGPSHQAQYARINEFEIY